MKREHFVEIVAEAKEAEIEEKKDLFIEHMMLELETDDNSICMEAFRDYYEYIAFGFPLDFIYTMMAEPFEIYPKTAAKFDPLTRTRSEAADLYSEWMDWFIENLDTVKRDGDSCLFYGYNSSGKSFTGLHILSMAVESGRSSYYLHSAELYRLHNQSQYEDPSFRQFFNAVKTCDFLFIDEIGKEVGQDETISKVFERIVKERSGARLPTIVATNMDLPEFEQKFGTSFWEQLKDRYHFFQFSKRGDFRASQRLEWGR